MGRDGHLSWRSVTKDLEAERRWVLFQEMERTIGWESTIVPGARGGTCICPMGRAEQTLLGNQSSRRESRRWANCLWVFESLGQVSHRSGAL